MLSASADLFVGYGSTTSFGTLSLTNGGKVTVGGITTIGSDGATGTVTLGISGQTDSGAALTSTGTIYVGDYVASELGAGAVNVYAGTTLSTAATLKIQNTTDNSVDLAGGTIAAGSLDTSGAPAIQAPAFQRILTGPPAH